MAVEAGTRLGRYLIHEYVGRGTLGPVYRACAPGEDPVAIKVLRDLVEPWAREQLLGLARRLEEPLHPNLVRVLDVGEHEGVPYLVVPYVPGGSLAARLETGRLTRSAALDVLRGVAAGVDHAHRAGLVHGALKPHQILLDGERPLVADLGVALLRWPRPDGVTVAVPEGSAAYSAPELVTGGVPAAATDRYAFATIAYELLVGQTPFRGESHDVMRAQLDLEPPVPSSLEPGLRPSVDEALLRGLDRDPNARWPTCTQLVTELTVALRNETSLSVVDLPLFIEALELPPAEPVALAAVADATPPRNRWPLLATGAVALAAALAGVGLLTAGSLGPSGTASGGQAGGEPAIAADPSSDPAPPGGSSNPASGSSSGPAAAPRTKRNQPPSSLGGTSLSAALALPPGLSIPGIPAGPAPSPSQRPSPTPSRTPTPTPSASPTPAPSGSPTPAPSSSDLPGPGPASH
jgi:serine/threonine-protein kinase